MAQIVPVSTAPNQRMRVSLVVDGQPLTLNLSLRYNTAAAFWAMDIASSFGTPLVSSIPLLDSWYPADNILAPYAYLKIGSLFVINQTGQEGPPNDSNLGSGFQLLWDDTPTV